jgi:Domain of unknown function (DUF3291)
LNLTVWETPGALRHYTYRSGHGAYFRRRSEWFEPNTERFLFTEILDPPSK